jgi:hypothetical protein
LCRFTPEADLEGLSRFSDSVGFGPKSARQMVHLSELVDHRPTDSVLGERFEFDGPALVVSLPGVEQAQGSDRPQISGLYDVRRFR